MRKSEEMCMMDKQIWSDMQCDWAGPHRQLEACRKDAQQQEVGCAKKCT
jgi:hypothetical protein